VDTLLAKVINIPLDVTAALREGKPIRDKKLEALREFTITVVQMRGWVPPENIRAFFEAGFTKAQALEVILGVALNTISNYTNRIAGNPPDENIKSEARSHVQSHNSRYQYDNPTVISITL
jgi:alkylhydroperoxidase family enzyme